MKKELAAKVKKIVDRETTTDEGVTQTSTLVMEGPADERFSMTAETGAWDGIKIDDHLTLTLTNPQKTLDEATKKK